jgi:ketosteroid isomerase-like protein
MSRENVAIVHRFVDAVNHGDRDAVAATLHPKVEWHTIGAPLLGVDAMHGRDETLDFIFERIPEGIEGFTATIEQVRELPDGRLLVIGHYAGRGARSGTKIEVTSAGAHRFEAGMIVFFRDWASEAEALEAVGLSE